jgi:hypothetical protein
MSEDLGKDCLKRLSIILAMMITLSVYVVHLIKSSRSLIDVWPLEGIFWETTITILVVAMLSYMLFRSWASVVLSLTVQAFLVVLLPVLKYPNALNIIGPWDSAAHYSFAKWIVEKGHIDTSGSLYYSSQYGFHPGNGVLPAVLSMISSLNLGWSMNAVLVVGYLGYVLLLMAILKRLGHLRQENVGIGDVLWLLAIFTVSINLFVYFGGVELGYAYVGSVLYLFLRQLIKKDDDFGKSMVLVFIAFLGLLATHLSTVVVVAAYLLIAVMALSIMELSRKGLGVRGIPQKAAMLVTLLLFVFFIYEVYVDVALFSDLVKFALNTISSLYVREATVVSKAMEVWRPSLTDLFLYLVSTYSKTVLVLSVALVHTIALACRSRALNGDEKRLALLLVASYLTWVIGWAGVGSFLSGGRAIAVISFFLSLSIAATYKKLYGFMTKRRLALVIPIVLVILGFTSNFGLPFEPIIENDGETHTYTTFSQGGFGDYVLRPIIFVESHTHDVPFLCLKPYTAFGLCDLMWNALKIPKHGFIAPEITTPDSIIEIIRGHLGKEVIIPQPMRDRLLPGFIGYRSLYEKPLRFLLENGKALVYSNGKYALFLV